MGRVSSHRGVAGAVLAAGLAAVALTTAGHGQGYPSSVAAQPPVATPMTFARPTLVIEASAPDSAPLLEELAERMFSTQSSFSGMVKPVAGRVDLLPGRLPDGLPIDVPLPPSTRVIGSALRHFDGRPHELDVRLEVAASVPGLRAFYEQELRERGWYDAPSFPGRGRFPVPENWAVLDLCRSDPDADRRWIAQIEPGNAGATRVRVTVTLEAELGMNCSVPRYGVNLPASVGPLSGAAPLLQPPEGQRPGTASRQNSGDGRWGLAEVVIETQQPLVDLERHYRRQLEDSGWVRQDCQAGAGLIWSTWHMGKIAGAGDWRGFLLTSETADPERVRVYVRVESSSPPRDVVALPPLLASLVAPALAEGMPATELPGYPQHDPAMPEPAPAPLPAPGRVAP